MPLIQTASWFTPLPHDHVRIGISRGVPRRTPAGYRTYRKLAPGTWFLTATVDEYRKLYHDEILGRLDPLQVAAELQQIAGDGIPVLVCFEKPDSGQWCHRALCAAWLAEAIGVPVAEVGYEHLAQHLHPLAPDQAR